MSQSKTKTQEEINQPSVFDYCITPKEQRQQRTRSSSVKRKKQSSGEEDRESKQRNTMASPETPSTKIEQQEPEKLSQKEERMKNIILVVVQLLLQPIQNDIKDLLSSQQAIKDDIIEAAQLKEENKVLTEKVVQLEQRNDHLTKRLNDLENKLLDSNIILHGIPESAWESESIRQDKVYDVISDTIIGRTFEECLEIAKTMSIKSTRRLGSYSSMRTRPVSVEFLYKGDAEYVLQNRKYLCEGIFVDKEYCKETEEQRKIFRPYFKAARRMPQYHRKCRLDGDTLVLKGAPYTVDSINRLPNELNGFNISSKADNYSFGFFGSLHPFSNFHPVEFNYNGNKYHSSEQLTQHEKALFFQDAPAAEHILASTTAHEAKRIAMDIQNYNHESWANNAKDRCVSGITAKFMQNQELQDQLIGTGNKVITECCYDSVWGNGVPLHDEHCLDHRKWRGQGIQGEILEIIREDIRAAKARETNETASPLTSSISNQRSLNGETMDTEM